MRSRKRNRIREGNPVVTGILYLLVILICAVTLYPMYYVLILSVSAPELRQEWMFTGSRRIFTGCIQNADR